MRFFFLSFSENLLQDAYIIFQNSINNFKAVTKQYMLNFGMGCRSPLKANPVSALQPYFDIS